MTRERIGVLYSVRDDLDLVKLAERRGYDSVWSAEGQGRTAFGKLERWATVTDRIKLSTGIVNIFSRSPAAVAQAAATLDTHSNGRVNLGLGVAHPGVVEEFHGMEFERALPRMAEYITLIRRYLAGEGEAYDGKFFSPGRTSFWQAWEPLRSDIPIYNAALGEHNVKLTGKYADGWLPNLYPLDKFEQALEWLAEGAAEAGRDVNEIDIGLYLLCAVNEDSDTAYRAAAQHIAYYLREIPGYYPRVAREAGYGDNVEAAKQADSLDEAADAIDSEFVDTIAVAGTPEEARDQLNEYREAGVNMPIVRGPSYGIGANREFIKGTVQALAPE